MSFDSTNMCYQIRRADEMEEIQRRQGLQQEEQEQQQHQQDTENAAAAAQIQPILQQAIVNGACETYEVNLSLIHILLACTYQAISGAGKNFATWPEMVDNVNPFIPGEEEKSEQEPLKIWGTVQDLSLIHISILPKTELKRIKPELIEKYYPKKD